jgi:signal transduction histidine kinase
VIRRLIVSYLALTLVVLVMLEIPLGITYRERQREQLEADLERDAFVLAAYSEDTLEGIGTLDLQALADGYTDRTGGRVVFVDRNGDVRADSDPAVEGPRSFSSRPEIEAALASQVSSGVRPSTTLGTDLLYVAVPVTSGGTIHGAVRISYPTSELDERVRSYWLLLGGVAAVSLTVAAGLAVVMARWVTRPVADLQVAATAIGQGALDARAPTGTGPPEIRELARALNTTAGRLEDLVDTQEQFVADASHELRTPLTALRLRLEMLETEVGDGAAHDLVAAEGEVQRLSRLVDGLLALARADRAPSSDAEDIAVDEVLAERADAWSAVVTERALRLEVTPSGLRVRATRDRLDQVLDNLLANACDAAPTGSVVGMGARMADDGSPDPMVDIHLTDSGPGLTEEQRSRAFDRFWRAGTTRTELGGSGLGLAIVRKLVRADQGDVELRAASPRGLEVIVRLPAAPSRRREN